MLNEEICKLRNKLNESIVTEKDYNVIYKLSVELDELIAEYYRKNNNVILNNYNKLPKSNKIIT